MEEKKQRSELRRKQLSKANGKDLVRYRKKDFGRKWKAKILLEKSLISSTASDISTISNKSPNRNP